MSLLEGPLVPFKTIEQRRALIGKYIRYLRNSDIDKSPRGYFFPRTGFIVDVSGLNLFLDNGDSLWRGDLVEVEIIELEAPDG